MELQKGSNKRVLWGTAQLFQHPRYMHGAATSKYCMLCFLYVSERMWFQHVGYKMPKA